MKIFFKTFSSIIALILIVSCAKNEEPTFTIEGTITSTENNYVLLYEETDIERKVSTLIDTIFLDAEGKFKAEFNLQPHLYRLDLGDQKEVILAIDKGQHLIIHINSPDKNQIEKAVSGSIDTEKLWAYEDFRDKSLDTLVQRVRREIKALNQIENPDSSKIDSLGNLEVTNYDIHIEDLNNFVKTRMGTTIGLYATSIRWRGEENLALFDSLVSAFEKEHQDLDISSKLREKITRLQQTSIGGIAANIAMKSANGTTLQLSDINKQYTLIDFWASWCGPCRRESESLNELYNKYNKKGFEIYGVSLDSNRDKWLAALEKDQRVWANVSSLEGFKTPAAFDYAVTALPDNYLIDAAGKIIAKNIHGEELEVLLEELFK
jgi:thiol-disulfide isomerase/thioredoxin